MLSFLKINPLKTILENPSLKARGCWNVSENQMSVTVNLTGPRNIILIVILRHTIFAVRMCISMQLNWLVVS